MNLNFEELKAAAIEKATIVAQKAKELASIAKAKLSIRAEEEKSPPQRLPERADRPADDERLHTVPDQRRPPRPSLGIPPV